MSTLPETLPGWLAYIERQHARNIDLGLYRVRVVYQRLGIALACPVITIGGTNGKGSTCAMVDSVLRCAGYRSGLYTSPHLLRYNERVRVDGVEVSDASLCEAFAAVEAVRGDTPLTYFEFGTLAALWEFARRGIDVVVLEVGLGGRLDAVNLVDADVAAVVSVGLDHMEYLGPTREAIGREKAGIFRARRPAICADPDPPQSVLDEVQRIGAKLWLVDRDFGFASDPVQWRFWSPLGRRTGLPHPALRGRNQLANAATSLAVLDALRDRLPVPAGAIRAGLIAVEWPARFQVLPGRPQVVLDVAHNPHAAQALAANLAEMPASGITYGVVGVLADKDAAGVLAALAGNVDRWLLATLDGPRGRAASSLRAAAAEAGIDPQRLTEHADPGAAYHAACEQATEADRIIVFGSFHTVASVLAARQAKPS